MPPLPTVGLPTSTVNVAEIYKSTNTTPSSPVAIGGSNISERQTFIDKAGRMWFAYGKQDTNSLAYHASLNVSYSDDNGVTWTEEEIDVSANYGTSGVADNSAFIGEANNGELVVVFGGDWTEGANRLRIYRRIAGTWTEETVLDIGTSTIETFRSGAAIYNHPDDDDVWIIVAAMKTGAQAGNGWIITKDNWATKTVTQYQTATGSRGDAIYISHGISVLRSADERDIYFFYHMTNTIGRLKVTKIENWDTTITTDPTIKIEDAGVTSEFQWIKAWWSGEDEITVYALESPNSDVTYYTIDVSGAGPVASGVGDTGLTGVANFAIGGLDTAQGVLMSCGYPVSVANWGWDNPVDDYGHGSLVMTVAGSVANKSPKPFGTNVTSDHGYVTGDTDRFGAVEGMAAIWFGVRSSSLEFLYVETDNVVYGIGSALPTKLVTTEIEFTSEGVPPSEQGTIISTTRTAYTYGGRQMIRDSDGVEHMLVDGAAAGLFLFSRADGLSAWTATTILADGTTFDAAALHLDADGQPWCAVHKVGASNIRIYGRESGNWFENNRISTGAGTIQSFEIWYDGTLHHILYPHKSGTGKWKFKHRTSTKVNDTINRWSGSTVVWDTGSSNNPAGPGRDKRIAGMLDGNVDFHACLIARDSGDSTVRYYIYDESAGTWAKFGFDLDSASTYDYRWATACIDTDDRIHFVYGKDNTDGLRYFVKDGGTATLSDLTTSSYGPPSLTMRQGINPSVITTRGADDAVGEWSKLETGSWVFEPILTADQSYDLTFPHCEFHRRHNFSRTIFGLAFNLQGSTIYVGSSYIQWANETSASETQALFSQALKLTGFGYPVNDAEFSQVLAQVRDLSDGAEAGGEFDTLVSFLRELQRDGEEQTFDFAQYISYGFLSGGVTTWNYAVANARANFSQALAFQIEANLGSTDNPAFSQDIQLTRAHTVVAGVEFDGEVDVLKELLKTVSHTFNATQVVLLQKIVQLGVEHDIEFGASGLSVRDWNAYSDHFDPGWGAENDHLQVVFQYPAALPTQSVTFMRPNFGDARVDSRRSGSIRRNRTGKARTYRVPVYSTFNLEWRGIPRFVGEEWRQRVVEWLGSLIRYQDHNGVWHECIITDTDVVRDQGGPEHNTFRISLQKTERVDLSPSTAG